MSNRITLMVVLCCTYLCVLHSACKSRRSVSNFESNTLSSKSAKSDVTIIFIQTGKDKTSATANEIDIKEADKFIRYMKQTGVNFIVVPRNLYGNDLFDFLQASLEKIDSNGRKNIHLVLSGHGIKVKLADGSIKSILNDQTVLGAFDTLDLVRMSMKAITTVNQSKVHQNLFVLLSACFSGSLADEIEPKLANNPGFSLMTSSGGDQVSGYGQMDKKGVRIENVLGIYMDLYNVNSDVFKVADINKDQKVNVKEFHDYLQGKSLASSHYQYSKINYDQNEGRWVSQSGFFVFSNGATDAQKKAAILDYKNEKFVQRILGFKQNPAFVGSADVLILKESDRVGSWEPLRHVSRSYNVKVIEDYNKKTGLQESAKHWPHFIFPSHHRIIKEDGMMYDSSQLQRRGYIE